MFSSFLVIHRTSIVRQLFDTFFDYFRISERQDFEQSLIRNRTGNNNSSNFFWQLVQNKVFKNTNKLIVVYEIIDTDDLEQIKVYINNLSRTRNPVKIEKLIVIFRDELIAYEFDRLIEKFDRARIELSILSTTSCLCKKLLAECLITELRRIFSGSTSIYND